MKLQVPNSSLSDRWIAPSAIWFGFLTFLAVFFLTPRNSQCATLDLNCTFTREYITTLEYLRSNKNSEKSEGDLFIPENQARKIAEQVSRGCTGAALRFIKVTAALSHSGLTPNDSIKTGIEFSKRSDTETSAFVSVFLTSYLSDQLDLDIGSSMKMAHSLSTEFQGDVLAVSDDFETLAYFCMNTKELALPRPQCGAFAARIAKKGEKFSGGISDPFIKLFHFLISEKGPSLTTGQALTLAEQLMDGGKDTTDNFIQAFKYSTSSHGLGNSIQEAIQFARQMAFPQEPKDPKEPTPSETP